MWNDEDNNPYGSFGRRDSNSSDLVFNAPGSPPSGDSSPRNEPISSTSVYNAEEANEIRHDDQGRKREGGYQSRVEKVLYEHPDLTINIVHAGKNSEGGGNFITYTIRTGDLEVRRRYSDFSSLRTALVNLHPTLIIPPIPEKHTIADYAAKPTKAKEDASIIEYRKRMLTSFLNRCRRMKDVLEDGVFWRFLDPHASWSEVINSHPVSSVPKNTLKAPPLDPANPTPGHSFLPVPAATAKLKAAKDSDLSASGTPTAPPPSAFRPSAAAHTTPGVQIFGKFPPPSSDLPEAELDPYFVNFENSSKELENLLQGSMESVNKRTLKHYQAFSEDLADLGARLNGFSLSEHSETLAAAIEKTGQAVDSTYIATADMTNALAAGFSEPMREGAQFAGVVRSVLRYRILKRIQGEMTKDELEKMQLQLEKLEKSEMEAQRVDQYLQSSGFMPSNPPKRSLSTSSSASNRNRREEDVASIDSDFPSAQGTAQSAPSATYGAAQNQQQQQRSEPTSPTVAHKKSQSGNFVTNKIFGRLNHAIHGIVDVDPERTRRDNIGKTKESLVQLQQALEVSQKDVKDASFGVLKSLREFQGEKENDLKKYMLAYARAHIEWARRNLASWEEAKAEVEKIEANINIIVDNNRLVRFASLPLVCEELSHKGQLIATTSSRKKPKLTYSRAHKSTWDRQDHSIFASDEPVSGLASPRSSPHPQSPTPTNTTASPSTPRFLPSHIQEEVLEASTDPKASNVREFQSTTHNSRNTTRDSEQVFGVMVPNESDPPSSLSPKPSNHALPGLGFGDSDTPRAIGIGIRSSSPAKRSASERDEDEEQSHRHSLSDPSSRRPSSPQSPKKANTQHTSPMPSRFKQIMESDEEEVTSNPIEIISEDNANTMQSSIQEDVEMDSTASQFTPAQSTVDDATIIRDTPELEEQFKIVTELVNKEFPTEGLKGFVVSQKWLSNVESHIQKSHDDRLSKELHNRAIGPVDNSNIIDNDALYMDLTTADGTPFIPLKPGLQMGEDLQILPQEAWDLVLKWHGVVGDLHTIVRYMHNTSPADAAKENFQYELFPPIFTIQKIPDQTDSLSIEQMKEKDLLAVNLVTNRADKFQSFLRRAKAAANISMDKKVRIWKISEQSDFRDGRTTMPTPVSSRSASPANIASIRPKLVMDIRTFSDLGEGTDREPLGVKDETNNEKYNGSSTIGMIGFSERQILVLEEQISSSSSDEYVTDRARKMAKQQGLDISSTRKGLLTSSESSRSGSARRSPTPSGIMTRGRSTKKGRTRGCTGLSNLGNTCYMNSALQCLRSVEELTLYFLNGRAKTEINTDNALGYNGAIAKSYEQLLNSIYEPSSTGSFAPRNFKGTLGRCQPLFSGYSQQDSQEFLSFLVDGLHEDLNRIIKKPYTENPESDDNTVDDPEAVKALGEKFKAIHRARNDSVAMDLFNGFYKNTMVCPKCNKVSITFDPYSSVTLQLPFDSPFTHTITFASLHGPPVQIDVDIDRNNTVHTLKEYVCRRVGRNDATKTIMAEIYGTRFYKIFDDQEVLSEASITANDHLAIFELDEKPSNWPPPSSTWSRGMEPTREAQTLDRETGLADRMAVTVLHRFKNHYPNYQLGLMPAIVLITREEAKDFDSILRKVLRQAATLTTRNLSEQSEDKTGDNVNEEPDTVNMTDVDSSSSEGNIVKAHSIQSEDGLVDVSMRDDVQQSAEDSSTSGKTQDRTNAAKSQVPVSDFISPALRNLFTMRFFSNDSEPIPTNLSTRYSEDRKTTIESRLDCSDSSRTQSAQGDIDTSEDELADVVEKGDTTGSGHEDQNFSDSDDAVPPNIARHRNLLPENQNKKLTRTRRKTELEQETIDDYLIRYGEGIVVDWDTTSINALFEGTSPDDMRGQPTFKDMPKIEDPELEQKRAKRAARKKTGVTLDECFQETSKTEILSEDNTWFCGRCKQHQRAAKTLALWTVPDILMVHLKRFRSSRTLRDKMDIMVNFPVEGLDLTTRVGLPEGKSLIYDLFAVDNHYGGLGGGHYTAYAKNFIDKKWYNYNDQMVSPVSADHVISKDAYLLFYRRRSDKPLGPQYLQDIVIESWSENDSGEEQRPDDLTSLTGSSSDSLGAAVGHQQDKEPGQVLGTSVVGSGQQQGRLESLAKSALHDEPPPYASERELDEGIADMDAENPDDPLPSYESHGTFIGPTNYYAPTWSFDKIGPHAPPGSEQDNMSDSSTHVAPGSDSTTHDVTMREDIFNARSDDEDYEEEDFRNTHNNSSEFDGMSHGTYSESGPVDKGIHHRTEQGFGVMDLSLTTTSSLDENRRMGGSSPTNLLSETDSRMSVLEPEEHVAEITLSDDEDELEKRNKK